MLELVKDSITNLGVTIVNGIKGVFEYLFVPSDNLFDDVETLFKQKFGFIYQIIDLLEELKSLVFGTGMPSFDITLYGKKMTFVDFSMYDKYRDFIQNITVAIAYYFYFIWLLHELPSLIGGITSGQMFIATHQRHDVNNS